MNNLKNNGNKFVMGVIVLVSVGALVFYVNDLLTPKEQIQEIVINSCSSIDPTAISIIDNRMLMFTNKDASGHTISIGGKSFNVRSGKSYKISPKFAYGEGNYLYDCDSVANAGQIFIVNSVKKAIANITEPQIFKVWFSVLNEDKKNCIKAILKDDFQKAYDNPEFVPEKSVIENIDKCLVNKIAKE
jgi:hypothetical protein